ncbi:hypothetical protein WR25_20842 isoform D [Diploscapter pachys]|uniref:Cytohesin Ubiquitin Protein Inducing domain-containing protein n=1 Tax=Diploscapter pachys TaxID=2018661 RepID=A0A2A2JPI2_9BILA|nr:hypothetical protein WR25_20842 isoform D [Diploscapter pachys]
MPPQPSNLTVTVHYFPRSSSVNCKRVAKRNRPSVSDVDQQELSEQLNRLASKSSIASSLPSLSSIRSSSSIGAVSNGSAMPAAKVADGSCSSLPSLKSGASQKSDDQRQKDMELYKSLQARRKDLEEKLMAKMAELKSVCLREGEITGTMPPEIHDALMPGEGVPKLKRRIGTAFSIPEELISADKIDKLSVMETEVELHRKIVAAAERLSKDKNMNKSVRKKRQKDLQAATLKLKGLEKGLSQMRLSSSKPDISSMGSADSTSISSRVFRRSIFSLLDSWAGTNGTPLTRVAAKGAVSCPTTPHGSVPDLSHKDGGDKSEYEDDTDQVMRRAPSSSSWQPQQRCSASSSTSSGSLGYGMPPAPRPTSRASRYSIRTTNGDELDNPLTDAHTHIYENVGYRSTSYRSSYRMAHYPTLQDNEQVIRKRALSAHSISSHANQNGAIPGQSTSFNEEDERQLNESRSPPVRRIPTSISCTAGFSTASLDRRNVKPQTLSSSNMNPRPTDPRREPMQIPIHREGTSADSSPKLTTHQHHQMVMQHRITTFPVQNGTPNQPLGKPYSTSELPRFKPPSGRLGPFPARLPQYPAGNGANIRSSSVSSSRLPAQTDPHMEALLDYYKNQARKNQQAPKTATIV